MIISKQSYLNVMFFSEFYPKIVFWIFNEIQMRIEIYHICKIVSNLRYCIFHDTLSNIAENGCMRQKSDIQ